jgi:two-component system nitrogen regulation response regulator GlnG
LVPALRDLGDDKLKLLEHYRNVYAEKHGTKPFALDDAARVAWLGYAFPGNVRELKNIAIRLTAKHSGYVIGRDELLAEFELNSTRSESGVAPNSDSGRDVVGEIEGQPGFNLATALAGVELQYIDAAIGLAKGNMSQAARLLGVSRSTLYSRLDALRPGQTKESE